MKIPLEIDRAYYLALDGPVGVNCYLRPVHRAAGFVAEARRHGRQ
jgi:hypothetical protein